MNETPDLETPIEKLVEIYQNYNKSSLDKNHLVCSKCNRWLTSPIYLVEEFDNICENCLELYKVTGIRNHCLEELLKNGKYPCKFVAFGCHVFEKNITDHENICGSNIKCSECNSELGAKEILLNHLAESHSMEDLIMEKPTTSILINHFTDVKLYHLQVCANSIILRLISLVTSNQIKLLFCNATDLPVEWNVTTIVEVNGTEYRVKGQVFKSLKYLFAPTEDNYVKMYIPNMQRNGEFLLQIYFANYEKVEPFMQSMDSILKELECPICLETINGTLNQCPSGHNICINCKAMIEICPICRLAISSTIIRINNIFSHLWRPCQNANLGCFVFESGQELEIHERKCPWKRIECVICKSKCNQSTILKHMMAEHTMQKCVGFWTEIEPGYISYNGRIFQFDIRLDMEAKVIKWYLRLLHDNEEAHHYEFNLRVKVDDIMLQVTCISQLNPTYNLINYTFASSKPNYSCMILFFGSGTKMCLPPGPEVTKHTNLQDLEMKVLLKQPTFVFRAASPVAVLPQCSTKKRVTKFRKEV